MIQVLRRDKDHCSSSSYHCTKNICILPQHAKRSTTQDNESGHTDHNKFGIQAYFADPYFSWQWGLNENANFWIRYYFPRGTNFDNFINEELHEIECDLNNRPRKRLNIKTRQEIFTKHHKNL